MPLRLSFDAPELSSVGPDVLLQFLNARVLFGDKLHDQEHLWVRNGKILSSEEIFFVEKRSADIQVDCKGLILAPGFIDIQLNGGFGVDFSSAQGSDDDYRAGVNKVAKKLLADGVTAFVPTLITSAPDTYKKVLPLLKRTGGGEEGAAILGAHLEGPFISSSKKGCHPEHYVETFGAKPEEKIAEVYGSLENVAIVTMAPELEGSVAAVKHLTSNGVIVSLGHSSARLRDGESGVLSGAKCLTHLFNAMPSYHHRDPGLIGLLTSKAVVQANKPLFYGIISDGIHTDDSALRIAHRTNPEGLVLVTDAMAALGMGDGVHKLGAQTINVKGLSATLDGTETTAGSVASMPFCVRHFVKAARCSVEEALNAASRKPAALLFLPNKGTLAVGADADFVVVSEQIDVHATFIGGKLVFHQ